MFSFYHSEEVSATEDSIFLVTFICNFKCPFKVRGNLELKKLCLIFAFAFFSMIPLFAKENLDSALARVSDDVSARISSKTVLAILDFSCESKEMGDYIRDSLISSFAENPNIRIVTRQNMDKVNAELDFQYSGYVSDETALSLCQRLGAGEIVFGRLTNLTTAIPCK